MSRISRRSMVVGLAMGFASSATALAQQVPDPLPMLPPASPAPPTVILSASPVVMVPPMGVQPTWFPSPLDPVATETFGPHHAEKKSRSWFWRRSQGKILGYPEQFCARPLGASVYDQYRTMVANGAAARLTLFDCDFVPGTGQLTPRGRIQLAKLSEQLAASPFPLIIESTPTAPSLANVRRFNVLAELAGGSLPGPLRSRARRRAAPGRALGGRCADHRRERDLASPAIWPANPAVLLRREQPQRWPFQRVNPPRSVIPDEPAFRGAIV